MKDSEEEENKPVEEREEDRKRLCIVGIGASAGGLEAHLSELCGDVIGGAAGAPGSDLAALEAVVRKIPDVRHRPVVHIRGVAGVGARFLGEGGCGESQ